ncbi:DNA polymerase domain-containing protein [Terriglobus aquaticus]|uniref:DNA polymerase domain-containing protein n=1 Tax=Terriglobus aquaticus TaxID=940139 RepID=A0ABW9KR25_9BACT|nr:DNA polymerase domain-containing protein [Terriglobus aquaticus]
MAKADDAAVLSIAGHEVRITNPGKPYFSREAQLSKLQLVEFYLSVAGGAGSGALGGVFERPFVLKRFVNGAHEEPFYQKRAPDNLPPYVRTVTLHFPSGRTADEVVIDNAAALAWAVNLGCIELHPHPVRVADLDHPDELRIDLDPGPGVGWNAVRSVARVVKSVMDEAGLRAWPKTSGSRGMHVNVRIEPRWGFTEVRRAALAVAREVERRAPEIASSKWWKEERHGVFLDYNQNAKDRTTCSAYSVRPLPDARVSTPLHWDEVMTCDPAAFTVFTVPERFASQSDPHAAMNQHAGSLEPLLAMAERDEANGIGDAPWPPHFKKMEGEPARVQPSKARSVGAKSAPKKAAKKKASADEETANGESEEAVTEGADGSNAPPKPTGRRQSKMPLISIGQGQVRAEVEAGLERWKARHPQAAALLAEDDILLDRMRGSAYVWYRIRVNLRHIPEAERPPQETLDPDDDPTRKWRESEG